MAQEGDQAPDFTLETDSAGAVGPGDFKGRPLILYFYPKDDTSGCTKEAIAFSERADDFARLNAAVIGISPDSIASHGKFRAKHGLKVILAADTERQVASAYGVWVEKSMYGRKYMGVERSTFLVAPDGRIVRVWRKVKVPGHADAVLEAVSELARAK